MTSPAQVFHSLKESREDELLVEKCLRGCEAAWSKLIDKYKNLIFSIPIKYGFSREDATDIFQAVCLALLRDLPRLQQPRALAAWLIQTTSHRCFRWKQEQQKYAGTDLDEARTPDQAHGPPEEMMQELEREQIVREAIAGLAPECKRLIELLFYEVPPVSYEAAAAALGLAKGSMGATRMRCLEKLRRSLEKKGFA